MKFSPRKFARTTFRSFVVVSLVVGTTVGMLWACSYWRYVGFERARSVNSGWVSHFGMTVARGRLYISRTDTQYLTRPSSGILWLRPSEVVTPIPDHSFAGLRYWKMDVPNVTVRAIAIPCWMIFLLCVPLPALELLTSRQRRAAKRHARGQCVKCGYDLRASPERCPECGTWVTGR